MQIFGLDFTSAPVVSVPARASDKLLCAADCWLDGSVLTVERFAALTGTKDAPFAELEAFLSAEDQAWVLGVDFPLGLPVGAIEYFDWCRPDEPASWQQYVTQIHQRYASADDLSDEVERWQKQRRNGDPARVLLFRYADQIAAFGGSQASSPMKISKKLNPPVGRMFFEGSKRLLPTNISILPMRPTDDPRVVIETYPRLVADVFIQGQKYKDPKRLEDKAKIAQRRKAVVEGLELPNRYGITVQFKREQDRQICLTDDKGDYLDSVLCAVQAGWSARQTNESGQQTFGIPAFSLACVQQQIALEGWIVDPLTYAAVQRA